MVGSRFVRLVQIDIRLNTKRTQRRYKCHELSFVFDHQLITTLQDRVPNHRPLIQIVKDALHFLRCYRREITTGALHLADLLVEAPEGTALFQMYKQGRGEVKAATHKLYKWPRYRCLLDPPKRPNWDDEFIFAFTPDGTRIIGSWGESLYIWDTESGSLIRTRDQLGHGLLDLVISQDGASVLAIDSTGALLRWELAGTGPHEVMPVGKIKFDVDGVHAFSHDGTMFLASSAKGLRVYPISGGQVYFFAAPGIHSAALSPDNKSMAISTVFNLEVIDFQTKYCQWSIAPYKPSSLYWSSDGTILAGATFDSEISIWDGSTGTKHSSINAYSPRLANGFDSRTPVVVDGGKLLFCDITDPRNPVMSEETPGSFAYICTSRNGRWVLVFKRRQDKTLDHCIYNLDDFCPPKDTRGASAARTISRPRR